MPGNDSIPRSSLLEATYHSIEHVNHVVEVAGWHGEFRQLGKGQITGRWRSLLLGPCSLTAQRFDQRTLSRLVPPPGCVAMGMPPPPNLLLVEGVEVGDREAIFVDANSPADVVTPMDAACDTLVVPQSILEASARALFPRTHMNGYPTRVFRCAPRGWSALRREMTRLLFDGEMSPEDVSNMLSRFLDLMTGDSEDRLGERRLGNGSARSVARSAQEYVEEHYSGTIRMEDLCGYTGVALRTLQRCFAEYFQVSPSEFIKARRLSAARQGLLAPASPDHTVTRIALGSGFTHLGRFSVEYRRQFGESPRETRASEVEVVSPRS